MLAPERHQRILQLIHEKGAVRTIDLAEEFQVTDETLRRDLQILADNNQLRRVHGGASTLSGRPALSSFSERRSINIEKKKAIAQAALNFIEPGKTYAFDSSTTIFSLVSILPTHPIRVVTNAYSVISLLTQYDHIDLHSTGGRFDAKTQTFAGGGSTGSLLRHNINRAFISCVGLDLERGASEGFEEQAAFKEQLVKYSERVILLVDSSKFNHRSDIFFASIDQINLIITDQGIAPEVVERFRKGGCELIITL